MSQTGTVTNLVTSEEAMDTIYNWIINAKNGTMVTKVVGCNYGASDNDESISGKLYGGTYLLIGYRQGGYANITAYSYWPRNPVLVAIIENSSWSKRFETFQNFIFQNASGNIKYGMNGIYIGHFINSPTYGNPGTQFNSMIHIIYTVPTSTVIYAFSNDHYNYGHLFFNKLDENGNFAFAEWKKLIA